MGTYRADAMGSIAGEKPDGLITCGTDHAGLLEDRVFVLGFRVLTRFPPVEEQLALIRRGVDKIVPEDELVAKLKASRESGKPLRIKYGIDPTGIDVHLGHTVAMRKMRQFQELGHQAVIIIGDYTARVGDPSGRDSTRARLTAESIEKNAATYLSQFARVLDLSQVEVVRNGDWFSKMSFAEILELCGKVTVAQLLTRDDFAKRMKLESPIFLHECLYPGHAGLGLGDGPLRRRAGRNRAAL